MTDIRADLKSEAAHWRDMATVRDIMRLMKKADRRVAVEMEALLEALGMTGTFARRTDAERWLALPITDEGRYRLLRNMERLTPSQREQLIDSLNSIKHRFDNRRAIKTLITLNSWRYADALERGIEPAIRTVTDRMMAYQHYELQKGVGLGWEVPHPSQRMVTGVVKGCLSGTVYHSEGPWRKDLREVVINGIVEGRSVAEIGKQVQGHSDTKVWQARRVVRTAMTEASTIAADAAMEEAGIDEVIYMATLDEATCPVCGAMDGRIFPRKQGVIGVTLPPLHPNCRCVIGAAPAFMDLYAMEMRSARDREGKLVEVPASMSFPEWRKMFYD